MGRSPCCPKEGLTKGAWTALEDQILKDYVKNHGEGRWGKIPKETGLKRCGKSCRLRWLNYLRPDIKRGNISQDEEDLIIRLHKLLGNRWSLIAGRLPGRTDNEIKNYWNTNLRKKVQASNEAMPSLTKPAKCANVNLPPPPVLKNEQHLDNDALIEPCNGGLVKYIQADSEPGNELLPITCGNDTSWDFVMELNVGQISLSEFLHSDFSKLGEFDNMIVEYSNDGCKNELSPSSLDQALFSEEMLKSWVGEDGLQPDLALDF